MTPDDPRHGSTKGYHAGCRDTCCRRAMALYEKRGRLNRVRGLTRAVAATGTQRRIQALMALGWTSTDIAHRAGWADRNAVLTILNGQNGKPTTWVERKTFERINTVFSELSMQVPEMLPHRARTKAIAARKGYMPPLAWDDIDDINERPTLGMKGRPSRAKTELDHARVERFLSGETNLHTTNAEKREILRRWLAAGRSERSLCMRVGWREGRYTDLQEAS